MLPISSKGTFVSRFTGSACSPREDFIAVHKESRHPIECRAGLHLPLSLYFRSRALRASIVAPRCPAATIIAAATGRRARQPARSAGWSRPGLPSRQIDTRLSGMALDVTKQPRLEDRQPDANHRFDDRLMTFETELGRHRVTAVREARWLRSHNPDRRAFRRPILRECQRQKLCRS